ncbi:Imm52 family immunity protein [Streptomyces capillispiralis]|uniref:Imm52 family immunity protein n=1 Tax=Streptomyces capillispiralis TaxID=68182 RepID=UPI00367DEF9B
MRRVVRGFWGPRQEPVETLAERWHATLDRFTGLLPAAAAAAEAGAPWTWRTAPASGPAGTLRPPDEASLRAALRTAQEADDWSAGNGTSLRLVADTAPGWKVEIAALAGGAPQFLLQSLVATIVSPDDAALPDAGLLTAVAEVWHPDYGDVSDRAVTAALKKEAGFRIGTPSVGWVAYLSPSRATRVPPALEPHSRHLPDDRGVLLTLASPGDVAAVVAAYRSLGEAGALEPLPQPMTRPTL